jgi:CRP/FNR family transcriptional regulator, cyclic AMP receptor protein
MHPMQHKFVSETPTRSRWGKTFGAPTILGQIDPDTLELLDSISTKLKFEKQSVILDENAYNENLYFVLSGTVRASYFSRDGKEISLADLGPCDCFGEYSVIDGQATSSSVIATQKCLIAVISRHQFTSLLARSPSFLDVLLRHLVSKIRQKTIRIVEFSSLPVNKRVRAELLRLAVPRQGESDQGVIAQPPTQIELANFVSSHREAVAREMAELARTGLIVRAGSTIHIPSLFRLRASIYGSKDL